METALWVVGERHGEENENKGRERILEKRRQSRGIHMEEEERDTGRQAPSRDPTRKSASVLSVRDEMLPLTKPIQASGSGS